MPSRLVGRPFGLETLEVIREQLNWANGANRSEIARRVCRRLEWTNRSGTPALMSARVALLRLHAAGLISLPPPRNGNGNRRRYQLDNKSLPAPQPLSCRLGDLEPVVCRLVSDQPQSRLWNSLIEQYHYLGHANLPGAQLRYLLYAKEDCLVGALGFGAAAWKLAPRDEWIGWNAQQRSRGLDLILNNARFLIVPWARVPNLAGHLLRLCLRQLPEDFQQRYGWQPLLLESFVEARFEAHGYRATNWIYLGQTQGRGKKGTHPVGGQSPLPLKQIWVYPLDRNFRRRLCPEEDAAHG